MASEHEDLRKIIVSAYNDSKAQHLYFLLGVAGAGVAFVIQKTDGERFTTSTTFAILAMLCWAISFVAGCEQVRRKHAILRLELGLARRRVYAEKSGEIKENSFLESTDADMDRINKATKDAVKFQSAQIVMLGVGVLAFVAWYLSRLVSGGIGACV